MRHCIKTLQKGKWFVLTQSTNPKTERKVYTIRVEPCIIWFASLADVREHFDPGHNRGSSKSWKYKDRKVAEQLLMMAILKWGA